MSAPAVIGSPRSSDRAVAQARWATLALTVAGALPLILAFDAALQGRDGLWLPAMILFSLNTIWVASAAATSVVGALTRRPTAPPPPRGWRPATRTAVLYLVCGESPGPVADRVAALRDDLSRAGLGPACDIFLLSDTSGTDAVRAETGALARVFDLPGVFYRRRLRNEGRKPGNIRDWIDRSGGDYDQMLVLDADSRMSAARIARLVHRMEADPALGLIQTGMRLAPAASRFGALQRLSTRLCGPVFTRGLSAWAGDAGNYWGHNALVRLRAFRHAARLPRLNGRAPFGGEVLSHDFVEAAWLRRAGWRVEIDADACGSFEEGPQTPAEFHRRDRRWCQGNLQHIRLLAAPNLNPVSRLHLLAGIQSYLSAPIWLALVVLIATGAVPVAGLVPLAGAVGLLLLLPKVTSLLAHPALRGTGWRARVVAKCSVRELALTSLVAPLIMVRQTLSVAAVLAGQDCGWKSGRRRRPLPEGAVEAFFGLALAAIVALARPEPDAVLWLAPLVAPMLAAPVLVPWLGRGVRG